LKAEIRFHEVRFDSKLSKEHLVEYVIVDCSYCPSSWGKALILKVTKYLCVD